MGGELLKFEQIASAYNNKPKQLAACKNWFPIFPSKELAEVIAALITDGHIDFSWRDGAPKLSKLLLYSNSRSECEWFLDKVYSLFGIRGKVVRYLSKTGFSKRHSYKALIQSSMLAKSFVLLGVPSGDKTKTEYYIPEWIVSGSPEIRAAFLRILFNFDGCVSLRSRRPSAIELNYCMNKRKDHIHNGVMFMLQIKNLLLHFGVKAGKLHIRHHKTDKFTLLLFVTNNNSVLNFYKYVGFLSRKKNFRLNLAVNRINQVRRVNYGSHLLTSLKNKFGTDNRAVLRLNQNSPVKYTLRQFEHMRRGESRIPLTMLLIASKILNKNCHNPTSLLR
ncbi:Replication factor C small subunit [Candidatus Bilamarchaeum dharawalense]|uniref:Replication factor C small subunit n=1 Tax=Candidatus Bilamarchaeum dharawalense TaxID=2885759 RepID=A0A5E4LS01_9ARCH|nr:Replication factor C small subunit [Candidatus Bilamarchaeum dharawalense]